MKKQKMGKQENETVVVECPICHASAVEPCKQPEKKESKECPRTK